MKRAPRLAAAALVAALAAFAGPRAPARADDAAGDGGPWEDVVFLPETGLSVLLERDPRGVLLDRASYLDLHRKARAARGGAGGTGARLLRCDASGVVAGEQAKVTVRLTVESRGAGREEVPLRLGGSVVTATLDGAPATLGADAKGGLVLSVRGDGFHDAVVEVVAPVVRKQGAREVAVDLPAAPASRWTLEIPGRVAATAGDGVSRSERLAGPDRTRLVAYGAAQALRASWREGDQGTDLPPLVRADVRTLAEVGERSLEAAVLLRLTCLRSPLDRFVVDLPPDLAVLGVDGEGASLVPATAESPGGAAPPPGRHVLRFAEPFTGVRTVLVRASRALPGPGAADLPVADVPQAATVDRLLAVRFTDGLRGFVEPGGGATRLDPAASEQGAVDALLRLPPGATARARSERPSVLLRADARVLLDLEDDGPWLALSFLYLPRGDRLYGVDPLLPAGFLPETVTVSGDRAFLRGTTSDGRLALVFPGGVPANGAVTVTVRGRWPAPGWGAEDAPSRTAQLPRLDAGTGAETEGWLGVSVPPGLEVREEATEGLVPASVAELRENAAFRSPGLALGWRFRGASPGGTLRVMRPEASVTAAVALLTIPAEDHLSVEGTVGVTVQRGGIREVRLAVVPGIGDVLRIEGPDVAEMRREPGAGRDTWIVRFGRLVRDGTVLTVRAELPLVSGGASVPFVSVEGTARQELRMGVAAHGELEVSTDASGLRESDPAEFAPVLGARGGGLLRAWKGERDRQPALAVRVVRLPPSPLPAAFADSVRLATVLGMDGIARTRLDARVRNADRQTLDVTLPPGAQLSSARVAGEAVRPLRRASGPLLVPIVPSARPFDVVLVYEEPVPAGGGAASLRAPDLGIPGSLAEWTVHLPDGTIPSAGPGEFSGPAASPGDPWLVRWVSGMSWSLLPQMQSVKSERRAGDAGPRGGAAAGPPPAAQPAFPGEDVNLDPAGEMTANEEAPAAYPSHDGPAPAPAKVPAAPKPAEARLEGRAAQRGLFGMDIRLLAAGPSLRATRLGPTGTLEVRWRSAAGRTATSLAAAVVAFLAALAARRRGVGAPTWTVLVLAFLTAAPMVLGTIDTSAWDAAAYATLVYAAVALLFAIARRLPVPFCPRRGLRAAAVLAAVAALAAAAAADEPRAKPPADPAGRVYVPYDPQLPDSLRTPERVFLPYARYRELWNLAHPEDRIEAAAPPVLVSAAYSGRVDGRALVVAAKWEIDPVGGGVVALPPGAAAEEMKLDGRAVTVTAAAPGGATLVFVPKPSSAGTRAVLEATLRWPVAGDPPGGALRAPLPRAPRSSLVLDVPVADAVVTLAAAGGWTVAPEAGGTRVTADLGPVDALDVSWQPRGADAAGGRTRFEVETEAAARLRPGLLEWSADVALRVQAGAVHEIDVPLAAGMDVLSVTGPGVASWTVVDGPALRVRLLGAGTGETKLSVAAILRAEDPRAAVVIPEIAVRGAAADRYRVSVTAADGRLAVAESGGFERTDAAGGAKAGTLAFRRTRAPSRLAVRLDPLADELTVASRQHLHLAADAARLRAEFDLTPGPRGLFEARVALPAGWTLDDAAGAATFPEAGAVRLVFAGSPAAARLVTLRLRGPVPGADALVFPVLRADGATRESADLLVSTAPGFAASAASVAGAEAVPADRFAAWPAIDPLETRTLAWRDARGGAAVAVRRDALQVSLRPTVVADLTVLDDRVIVDALVQFDVRGGVERVFRVDSPSGVRGAWVLGDGLREVRRDDVAGRERLTVTMQAASAGAAFRVLYDLPVPASGTIEVAGPEPVGGDAPRAFLLLRALGESEVQVGAVASLETCDVADLPLVPEGLDPVRVLRFLRARDAAWRLPLRLTAHEIGDLPEARIHLVEATTVADRDGSSRTRVDVRLFNRARSFLPVRLPSGASLESVLVGGAPVRPVAKPSAPGVVQVPVRVQSLGEESQSVSLTFRAPATDAGGRFSEMAPELPSFPDVPVDATTWRLFLPEDRDYSFSGNMDPVEEMDVAIARAEAYRYDTSRLRTVLEKGNRRQQELAYGNLVENTREMQKSLDVANSRLGELEQAAAAGRIDRAKLDDSRRKAAELARSIDEALADVEKNKDVERRVTAGAEWKPAHEQAQQADALVQERYATKEGQADKKWAANDLIPGAAQTKQSQAANRASRLLVVDLDRDGAATRTGAGKSAAPQQSADQALAAHEGFDDVYFGASAGFEFGRVPGAAEPGGPATAGVAESGGGFGGPPAGGQWRGRYRGEPGAGPGDRTVNGVPGQRPGLIPSLGQQGGADLGFFGGPGGGGGGGARVAPPVEGLISLAPPLVERGRLHAFRKLDAGAAITVSAGATGVGRRWSAVGAFAVVAGVVWLLHRRRARRAR